MMKLPNIWTLEDIAVGMKTTPVSFSWSEDDIRAFANFSGNHNPLHTDDVFAKEKGYARKTAYGAMLSAQFSCLIGMEMPGKNSLCLKEEIRFHKPIYAGDRCTMEGVVASKSKSTRTCAINMTVVGESGEILADGTMTVRIL